MSSSNPSAGPSFDAFERDLLRAGRAQTAPATARAQAVRAALATSAAGPGVPGPRNTSTGPGSLTGGTGLMKLAGFACAGAVSVLWATGALHALHPGARAARPAATAATSATHAEPGAPATVPTTVPPASAAPVWTVDDLPAAPAPLAPRAAVTARPAEPEESTLSAEIALLDRVRAATASGEPARALHLVDEYRTRFPAGVMASEAAVLRIEATAAAGDLAGARRLAKAFRAAHPQNPYAARIASVVGADL